MDFDLVDSALRVTGVHVDELCEAEKTVLAINLRERFGLDLAAHAPWDNESAPDGIFRADGWKLIPEFVGARQCVMYLDGGTIIWKFDSGHDLFRVLSECPAVEFYVCDLEASYLLCCNHHDCLIGWGVAVAWVHGLVAS